MLVNPHFPHIGQHTRILQTVTIFISLKLVMLQDSYKPKENIKFLGISMKIG
jgi:hypothetical protein